MTYARPTRPEQLLDLQHSILTCMSQISDKYEPEYSAWNSSPNGPKTSFRSPNEMDPDDWMAINYGGIIRGPLIWVTSDMCDLLDVARKSVPLDTTLHESFMAFPQAVAFMEKQIDGMDLLTWRPAIGTAYDGGVNMTSLDLSLPNPMPIFVLDYWSFGHVITDEEVALRSDAVNEMDPQLREDVQFTQILQRQIFVSLNLLITQPGITTIEDAPISRPFQRRAERRNQLRGVRIVRLRHASHNGHSGAGHHLTKRFIVRGHWRNQTWGPRGSLRRPTWISPHLKGPEGAPLDTRPTVFVANASPDEVTA